MEDEEAEKEEAPKQKPRSASHHLDRRCLVQKGYSGYEGANLKRHLMNVHVKNQRGL